MTRQHLTATGRRAAALALAAIGLTLAAHPASAQPYDDGPYTFGDVTITAPRIVGRSAIGAPIERVSASRVVPIGDLDLGAYWGRRALRARVSRAARSACDELDARYPITDERTPDCYATTFREGMVQAEYATGYALAER
ncbi:MAG: UrcA family protein [Caulobacteraceae bacterium]